MAATQTVAGVRTIEQALRSSLSQSEIFGLFAARVQASSHLNAFITHTKQENTQSREQDKLPQSIRTGSLSQAVIAVKDNFCTKGVRTTCASNMLRDFVPPYDATVVSRLKDQGAQLIGKTNLDEFAMGTYNTTSFFGPAFNPWTTPNSTSHVSGGSSGGSAVAVAASLAHAALGSDTGGSIRLPASYCGVVGWKPSYGRLSRFGLVSYASSLDTPGVFAHTVRDAALVANVCSGRDVNDATSLDENAMSYVPDVGGGLDGITIGIPQEYLIHELAQEVADLWDECASRLASLGAKIVPISLPLTKAGLSCYYIIALAEASSNLARYDGLKYGHSVGKAEDYSSLVEFYTKNRSTGFGPEVARRILGGTFLLSRKSYDSYYVQAQRVRQLVIDDFNQAFDQKGVDVILVPTAPGTAPTLEETKQEDRLLGYAKDVFTVPASLAGLPAINVPAGLARNGLPLGMQLLGQRLNDSAVLRVAQCLEESVAFPGLHL